MKKAAAKSKSKSNKPAKKRNSRKSKKPADLVEVRKGIADIVTGAAGDLTKAVVEEGRKGQLAPVKYLFEVAGLYPAAEGTQAKPEGESLARTLLHRLGLPEDPVIQPEEEPPMRLSLPGGKPANGDTGDEEESGTSGLQPESQNNQAGNKDSDEDDDVPVPAKSIP
jgi:hypothetical protein